MEHSSMKRKTQPRPTLTKVAEFWTPESVSADEGHYYLFGDNEEHVGTAGQACIRGLKNAFGIPTLKAPGVFWSDDEFDSNCKAIDQALSVIPTDKPWIMSADGLGTGLAELPARAPKTFAYLESRLAEFLPSEKVLVLRTCTKEMTGTHDAGKQFTWPESGPVECTDWKPTAECGNGLHGLLWGDGEWNLLSKDPEAKWLVVEVDSRVIVDLGGKVKFPRGEVVYCGNQAQAIVRCICGAPWANAKKVVADAANASSGDYSKNASSGDYSQNASSGDSSKNASSGYSSQNASSGDSSQNASSGDYSQNASSGDSSQNASSGDSSKNASSGYSSQNASSGDYSQNASSGYSSKNASSGDSSKNASSGDSSQNASSGDYSQNASSGDYSQNASSGYSSQNASSGDYSQNASSGDSSQNASSGYSSKNASSGDYSQNASSGDYSQNASSGDSSQNASSGDYSQNASSGDYSISVAAGDGSMAMAGPNSCIALRWTDSGGRPRVSVGYTFKVKGFPLLKEATWYSLDAHGNFLEVNS